MAAFLSAYFLLVGGAGWGWAEVPALEGAVGVVVAGFPIRAKAFCRVGMSVLFAS